MTNVEELLIAIIPSIFAVLSVVGAVAKMLHDFKELKKSVNETTNVLALKEEIDEVKDYAKGVYQENIQLKRTLKEVIAKQNNVVYEGDPNEN